MPNPYTIGEVREVLKMENLYPYARGLLEFMLAEVERRDEKIQHLHETRLEERKKIFKVMDKHIYALRGVIRTAEMALENEERHDV